MADLLILVCDVFARVGSVAVFSMSRSCPELALVHDCLPGRSQVKIVTYIELVGVGVRASAHLAVSAATADDVSQLCAPVDSIAVSFGSCGSFQKYGFRPPFRCGVAFWRHDALQVPFSSCQLPAR